MDNEKIKALLEKHGFESIEIKIGSRYFRFGKRPESFRAIASPLPGTFYQAPAPGADLYVRVGDFVEIGAVLCIVEAMKMFNEIKAEFSGIVVEICMENQQTIQLNEILMFIESNQGDNGHV